MSKQSIRYSVGPFKYKKGKNDDYFKDALIDSLDEDLLIKTKDGYDNRVNLHDGDWHLFAAAPDVLEALEALVSFQENNETEYLGMEHIRAYMKAKIAIAKAKGEQQ